MEKIVKKCEQKGYEMRTMAHRTPSLIFSEGIANNVSTHFRGFLFDAFHEYPDCRGKDPEYDPSLLNSEWKFRDVVARLYSLGLDNGQDIFLQGNDYQSTFGLEGTYKGKVFDLYDHEGDTCVNIGGTAQLDVKGLKKVLAARLKKIDPTPFKVESPYTGEIYKFKG